MMRADMVFEKILRDKINELKDADDERRNGGYEHSWENTCVYYLEKCLAEMKHELKILGYEQMVNTYDKNSTRNKRQITYKSN